MQASLRIAFKEWAVVVEALGHGEQILLLRKGGIRENCGEFHVDHRRFWLFPTVFHEAEESVIPSKRPALREIATRTLPGFANIQYLAEVDTAVEMLRRLEGTGRRTVAGDRGYDNRGFVKACRDMGVTPHVAQNLRTPGGSAIDGRTTRHPGYEVSQRKRKRIEEVFGWIKTVGRGRKLPFIGVDRNRAWALMTAATYNLVRMATLSLQAG